MTTKNQSISRREVEINKILKIVATNKFAMGHLDVYRDQLLALQDKNAEEIIGEDERVFKLPEQIIISKGADNPVNYSRNALRAEQRDLLNKHKEVE